MAIFKNKIFVAFVILVVLAGAWVYGGNYKSGEGDTPPALALPETSAQGVSGANRGESRLELDKYKTEPVPEGKPAPAEPQDTPAGDGSFTVTLSVRCDTLLDNLDMLDKEKHELVPADGIIYPATEVTAYDGESVFNVFQREMKRAGVHMSFRSTPIYNSAYILDVNNLH